MCAKSDVKTNISPLRQVFDEIDEDRSGSIDEAELERAFRKLGLLDEALAECDSKAKLDALIACVDSDHNGRVQWEEFELAFGSMVSQRANARNGLTLEDIMMKWSSFGDVDIGSDLTLSGAGGHENRQGHSSSVASAFPLWYYIFAGGLAGVCSRSVTAPLERVKIQQQVGNIKTGMLHALHRTHTNGGVRALYAGNLVNCARVFPLMGLSCLFYGRFVKELKSLQLGEEAAAKSLEISPARRFVAGALAGGLANTLTYPLDVVRARLSAPVAEMRELEPSKRLLVITRQVFTEGAAFRGLGVTLLTAMPMMGITQSAYDVMKDEIVTKRHLLEPSAASFGFIGGVAGVLAQIVVFPMDTIRRRMQVFLQPSHGSRGNIRLFIGGGLYQGLGAACVKVLPAVAVSLTVRDWMLGRI